MQIFSTLPAVITGFRNLLVSCSEILKCTLFLNKGTCDYVTRNYLSLRHWGFCCIPLLTPACLIFMKWNDILILLRYWVYMMYIYSNKRTPSCSSNVCMRVCQRLCWSKTKSVIILQFVTSVFEPCHFVMSCCQSTWHIKHGKTKQNIIIHYSRSTRADTWKTCVTHRSNI